MKMHCKTYSFTLFILQPSKITWPQECLNFAPCTTTTNSHTSCLITVARTTRITTAMIMANVDIPKAPTWVTDKVSCRLLSHLPHNELIMERI